MWDKTGRRQGGHGSVVKSEAEELAARMRCVTQAVEQLEKFVVAARAGRCSVQKCDHALQHAR